MRSMVAPTTYLDAALQVLREAQNPMTSDEITDEAIRRGLLAPNGKTPRRTMSACLYTWVKKAPSAPIERIFTPGPNRAQRGSVRWRIRNTTR
jgi:hypothetical protein